MKDELAARVRIPYELLTVGRELIKLVVPLRFVFPYLNLTSYPSPPNNCK